MFKVIKDGVEVTVVVIENLEEIVTLLNNTLSPAVLKKLNNRDSDEFFFQFSALKQSEPTQVLHYLVHLVRKKARSKSGVGTAVHVFKVAKEHLAVALEIAKDFKSYLKNLNDWNETDHFGAIQGR